MDENDRVAIAVLQANARSTETSLTKLENKVDAGFTEVKGDIKRLDTKMDAGFAEMRGDIRRLDTRMVGLFLFTLTAIASGFFWLAGRMETPVVESGTTPAQVSTMPAEKKPGGEQSEQRPIH